jgi:hypothetical protein
MLIATVPYVGKRLHLDPEPKLITDPDPNMQIILDPAGSGSAPLYGSVTFWASRIRYYFLGLRFRLRILPFVSALLYNLLPARA